MASQGQIESFLNALPADLKKILLPAFAYALEWFALGDSQKATNFGWYKVAGTTASAALTEFSIEHGMDVPPSKFIPIVDLTAIHSQLVPLVVSRAPDARRIYFKSTSTSAAFSGYLE